MISKEDLKELGDVSIAMLSVLESLEHVYGSGSLHDEKAVADAMRSGALGAYHRLEERAKKLIGHPRYSYTGEPSSLEIVVSALAIAREKHHQACRARAEMEQAGTSPHSVEPEYLQLLATTYSRLSVLLDATARFIEMARKLRAERKEGGGAK